MRWDLGQSNQRTRSGRSKSPERGTSSGTAREGTKARTRAEGKITAAKVGTEDPSANMSVREIASAEFYELSRRSEGKLLVTQFTATWCGPCRRVAPQYEALARRMPEVEFVKVYEHNSRDAIMASGVRSFPTFHFYVGGAKVDECRGANIAQVEQKASQHMAAASAASGPVMIKLRFEREKPRESGQGFILVAEETELEVHASEGLEIFKFQVLSLTDIETDDQSLAAGDSATPIATDADLTAALRRTGGGVYGNYPIIRVSKRATGAGGAGAGGAGAPVAREAAAEGRQGVTTPPDLESCCSRTFFGKKAVIQPAYVIREESLLPELTNLQKKKAGPEAILVVCKACAENCFVPGRAEHSPAISSRAAFVCQSKEACVEKGYGSDLFSGRADAGAEVLPPGTPAAAAAESAAAAAADAVYYAARGLPKPSGAGADNEDMARMRRKIQSGMSGVLAYEDAALQEKARAVLPPAVGGGTEVAQKGAEIAAEEGLSGEEGLARALLSWFKKDFFKWTNKPPCSGCGKRGGCMQPKGVHAPSPEEASHRASRVELYECKDCGVETRYPRYNDPAKLLETRNGRCGEWANCFTLMCRAVGLEARSALDWTDHVWTEIWIPSKSAWVHADSCENKLDKPLMYEQGWNKRLSYVIAFDRNGAVDVTPRYTRRWLQVLSRRNLAPEKWLAGLLAAQSRARTEAITNRLVEEQQQLKAFESMGYDGKALGSEEMEGRQSGDAEWVASRGEDGGGKSQLKNASAPNAQTTATSSSKPAATSALVGVPVGVPQPDGGGLAICVAAVVERSGDASVLVGGAAVCRLAGRGLAALCAAAVSPDTGTLLDAKTFVLGDGRVGGDGSSTAAAAVVVDWLAGLPDGAMVAVAAGGGGTQSGAYSPDAGLADAMAKLVGSDSHSSSPDAAEGKETTADSVPTRGWFTLVGSKGSGPQKWARRQHGSTQENGGGCAVYAELVLATAAPGVSNTETEIKLRDKLALCPLRSVPGGDGAEAAAAAMLSAPVRGVCRREGEPTVSVGPALDLVDCPGWTTTVLKGSEKETGSDHVGGKASSIPVAWRAATVYPAVGGTHEDTEEFDDGPVGCPAFVMGGSPVTLPNGGPFLPAGRVREIIGWSGDQVNGVQVVYDVEGDIVRGPKRVGDHGLYRQSKIVLDVEGGEVLTSISVKAGAILDSLCVRTSKGQEKRWGADGGHLQQTWHIPPGTSFLGFHGGMGGHVHSLGVTLAETGKNAGGQALETSKSPYVFGPSLAPIIKTNLYSTHPVPRACAQFVALNAPLAGEDKGGDPGSGSRKAPKNACLAPEEVVSALETMRKYADNLLASPLDPKFSRIRLANGFFDRKIGRLPGGGGVIRAMGFELVAEGGRMHYVFRRNGSGAKGGLEGLRCARQALIDVTAMLKPSAA